MFSMQDDIINSLKTVVAEKLKTVQNFNEDVNYVAEYIVLLLSNGGTYDSILQELLSLFDSVSQDALSDVVNTSFQALKMFQSGDSIEMVYQKLTGQVSEAANASKTESIGSISSTTDIMSESVTSEQSTLATTSGTQKSAFEGMVDLSNSKYSSKSGNSARSQNSFKQRYSNNRSGNVGKNISRRSATYQGQNKHRTNALARALGMNGRDAGADVNFVNVVSKKDGRCKLFPRCPLGKYCPHAHPTKVCKDYPNCKNDPGTCEYLHTNEDVELMKEIEKTREEFRDKRLALAQSRALPTKTGIVLCKFGILCSNQMCPFGHPTPSNEDAKVIQFVWCLQNLSCENKECDKAHSSLSKIRNIQPMSISGLRVKPSPVSFEKSLEQCKFGMKCTNKRCRYRHARSHIMCRDGASCTRIDCLFGHPINEPCKFGRDCKNFYCLFHHPEGRVLPEKPPSGTGEAINCDNTSTGRNQSINEREYAVPESAVIERAPVQESDGDATMA